MTEGGNHAPERNLRLLIEYDGAPYIGWQQQPGQFSVEGELLSALNQLIGESPALSVAGRTDTGVHAVGQVANFHSRTALPLHKITGGLNHYLPNTISIHRAEEVDPEFDARRHSTSKFYRYRIYHAAQPAALETRAWYVRHPIDTEAMKAATAPLIGEHDFNAFRSAHCEATHAVREFFSIAIERTPRPPAGEYVDITFHANAYCRHMCRILAGTLLDIGVGRLQPEGMEAILASRDRTLAGRTAPPQGLTLLRVVYP